MDNLSKIFGGPAKIKIIRLFLFNEGIPYDKKDVVKRSHVSADTVMWVIKQLKDGKLIKDKNFTKEVKIKGKKDKTRKKKTKGWILNDEFPHLKSLQNLLIEEDLITSKQILTKLRKAGALKLVVTSGVFMHLLDSRVDLLIVGDNIKMGILDKVIRDIESHVGKELTYAVFETKDFLYRVDICDKLIRDILDYPHQKILKKIEVA